MTTALAQSHGTTPVDSVTPSSSSSHLRGHHRHSSNIWRAVEAKWPQASAMWHAHTRPQGRHYGADRGPYIIAHRGGAGIAPENTMEAFAASVAYGVRYLETDVRSTSDGVAVAFHDENLERVTGIRGKIRKTPWSVVRKAMVNGSDQGIVTVEDLLGSFPGARFSVDVKDTASIGPLVKAIKRTRSAGRVCVAGGWDGWLQAVADQCGPKLSTALGWQRLAALIGGARAGVKPQFVGTGSFAHVPLTLGRLGIMSDPVVGPRLVCMAHALGVRVLVWTVDDPFEARRLIDNGVSGVFTDRPDIISTTLAGSNRLVLD